MSLDATTETDAVAALALKTGQPFVVTTDSGREFLVGPREWSCQDVTPANAVAPILPDHIGQAVTLQATDSLVDYVNRYRTADTILLADIDANTIRAVIDYHAAATMGIDKADDAAGEANHAAHIASMVLPLSFEWKTWAKVDGVLMEQLKFARFLEENAPDITAPDGADILEACRDLQARRKVDFRKAVRTSSNNENFEFVDETNLTNKNGGIEVPTKFKLEIPVYFGRRTVELFAFLRWELVEGGGLMLGVQSNRAEHVRQAEFKQIVVEMAERTECPAMFGKLA
jgi:uncharacterized protein YfdQ (DUF2303 family)